MSNIQKAIKAELKRRDWTVYELAKQAGGRVAVSTIYQYLRGQRGMSVLNIEILLEVLELKVKK